MLAERVTHSYRLVNERAFWSPRSTRECLGLKGGSETWPSFGSVDHRPGQLTDATRGRLQRILATRSGLMECDGAPIRAT